MKIDYKWKMLALVSATYFLAQGTRQIYNAVLPQIKVSFASSDLTDAQLGLVGSVFTLVFGLVIPLAGFAADFFRRKWMIVLGALVFSTGIFLSGFAAGIGMLIFTYGILNAAGQSAMPPSISSLIGQLHVSTRATAFAIYQMTFYVGIVILSSVSGWLSGLGEGKWRMAFWIFGAAGILWTFAVAALLKDTPQPVAASGDRPSFKEAVAAFFGKPTAVLLTFGVAFYVYSTYGFKTWVPMYLLRTFPDMTPAAAAFHAVFWYYLGAIGGVMAAGRISDRLRQRRRGIRLETNVTGLLIAVPFILLAAFTSSIPVMFAAIFGFGVATGIYDSNLYAALLDVVNPRYRAAAVGIYGFGANVLGSFGSAMCGWLNDRTSMRVSVASLAAFAVVGAVIILFARLVTFGRDAVAETEG